MIFHDQTYPLKNQEQLKVVCLLAKNILNKIIELLIKKDCLNLNQALRANLKKKKKEVACCFEVECGEITAHQLQLVVHEKSRNCPSGIKIKVNTSYV